MGPDPGRRGREAAARLRGDCAPRVMSIAIATVSKCGEGRVLAIGSRARSNL